LPYNSGTHQTPCVETVATLVSLAQYLQYASAIPLIKNTLPVDEVLVNGGCSLIMGYRGFPVA